MSNNVHEDQYLNLLRDVMENGQETDDRTGVGTISVFGRTMRFDLSKGFPALTTKKLAWLGVVSELLWFIEGSGDERRLAEIRYGKDSSELSDKTTIWTANADAPYWKPKAQFEGDLGRVYGVQWRNWRSPTSHQNPSQIKTVDQLRDLVHGLEKDPNSRRHILTAWNPGELDQMALPPCHMMAQFSVKRGKLSCLMFQRSVDLFLGSPFNIASYALFTHMLAHVCEYEVGELIISMGDVHIYKNHIDQVKEQLSRDAFPAPKLQLNPNVGSIDKFTMNDIRILNYQSHDMIKAEMAV